MVLGGSSQDEVSSTIAELEQEKLRAVESEDCEVTKSLEREGHSK